MHRLALCLILISSTPLSETIIDQARRNRAIHSPAAPTLHEDSHGMHVQVVLEAACALTPMGLEQQALKTSLSRQLQTSRTLSSHLIKLPRAEDSHPSRAWTSRNGCHLESTRTVSGLAPRSSGYTCALNRLGCSSGVAHARACLQMWSSRLFPSWMRAER